MTKEEIDNIVIQTKEIINFSGYKFCSKYSLIHSFSNEQHKRIAEALGGYKDKSVLTVAASGEQYLSALIEGAKKVVLYDINLLTKFYVYLKIGAILVLKNYNDFYDFTTPDNSKDKYFNKETILKIGDYIPNYILYYWEKVIKEIKIENLVKLFFNPVCDNDLKNVKENNQQYLKQNYELLKKLIEKNGFPNFVNCSVEKLPSILKGENFDIISTSNIIESIVMEEWISDSYCENTIPNWIDLIISKLSKILKENGQIIVDYDPSIKTLIEYEKFKTFNLNEKSKILVYKKQ